MKLFTIQHNRATITPDALTLNEFRDIWDRDESSNKIEAITDLAYVYWMEVFDSPFVQYSGKAKEDMVLNQILKSKTKIKKFKRKDPLILEAREVYKKLQETPTLRMYNSMVTKLEDARISMEAIDFSDDHDGKKFTTLNKNIELTEKSMISLNRIKDIAVKEMTEREKVRANARINRRELPKDER